MCREEKPDQELCGAFGAPGGAGPSLLGEEAHRDPAHMIGYAVGRGAAAASLKAQLKPSTCLWGHRIGVSLRA